MTSRFEEMAVSEPLPLRESPHDNPTSRSQAAPIESQCPVIMGSRIPSLGWSQRLPAPMKRPTRP